MKYVYQITLISGEYYRYTLKDALKEMRKVGQYYLRRFQPDKNGNYQGCMEECDIREKRLVWRYL